MAKVAKKRKAFPLRNKPKAPERYMQMVETYEVRDLPYGGDTLQTLIDWAHLYDVCPRKVSFYFESGYDGDDLYAKLKRVETDAELAIRQKEYDQQLAKYEKWRAANEGAIKAELERREKEKKKKKKEDLQRIEKKIVQGEKELAKLRKRLDKD